jgi:hypothetical protein
MALVGELRVVVLLGVAVLGVEVDGVVGVGNLAGVAELGVGKSIVVVVVVVAGGSAKAEVRRVVERAMWLCCPPGWAGRLLLPVGLWWLGDE